jgi:hypothetical protein
LEVDSESKVTVCRNSKGKILQRWRFVESRTEGGHVLYLEEYLERVGVTEEGGCLACR